VIQSLQTTDLPGPPAGVHLQTGDALIVVDAQNDFLPGGALAVASGNEIIPVIKRYIDVFRSRSLPIFFTRDWHPANHCFFVKQGGPWPVHCVAGSAGADFPAALRVPPEATIVSKGTAQHEEAYSGFEGTPLLLLLRKRRSRRLFVGGLATDYCVLATVKNARAMGFDVMLLTDAVRGVNVHSGDAARAEKEMLESGALPVVFQDIRVEDNAS
jgi:nicotinamidase/pyrazinamidase